MNAISFRAANAAFSMALRSTQRRVFYQSKRTLSDTTFRHVKSGRAQPPLRIRKVADGGSSDSPTRFMSINVPTLGERSVPVPWLRENCPCSQCRHPETRQRLVDTFSLPEETRKRSIDYSKGHATITWEPDGHQSRYSLEWLRTHVPPEAVDSNGREAKFMSDMEFVPASSQSLPTVDYANVMKTDDGVREWTKKIYQFGFCFVKGCPVTPEATQELLERIALIRHTHYGGFWDFTSDLAKKDTAYTTYGLGVHTDTTYFTDPAGLQMFHLLSHTGGTGGETTLVDGFKAASTLFEEDRSAYYHMKTTRFSAHSSGNEDAFMEPARGFGTFTHNPDSKELYIVRWNNDDRGAVVSGSASKLGNWYSAARKWNEILKRKDMMHQFKLEPGTPLIFDNWRMLHGRTAFDGKRRLCGGYINHDDYMSRYRLLNIGREKLQNSI